MDISPIGVSAGRMERRAISMVLEWAALHQDELMENWRRLREGLAPNRIEPLH